MHADWVVWGSELSPFHLKLVALCRHAGLPVRVLPGPASRLENLRFLLRRRAVVRGRLPLTWPRMTELDELPLVPFLFGPAGENLYDTSAIAEWLDAQAPAPRPRGPLLPADPAAAFVAHLVDEFFDEWVLYLLHHQRWVVSARDTAAGAIVAREFRTGPAAPLMARWFERRQTRRLPYLFSVAPPGFRAPGVPAWRQPPSRAGFPPTHELLEDAFTRTLAALEPVLAARGSLLGGGFTLADASAYGALGVHPIADPTVRARLQRDAPATVAWLARIRASEFPPAGPAAPDGLLRPLLAEAARTFLPLMRQNEAAYERLRAAGQRGFNERAFDRGQALYDGVLDGRPFRAVVKTFQVRTWRQLRARWQALDGAARARVAALLPAGAGLD